MSTQPLIGSPSTRATSLGGISGSVTLRAALTAVAVFTISVPSLFAKLPTPAQAAAAASGTISALISSTDANFASDAAAAIRALANTDNSVADETAIVKAALGTISDAITVGTKPLSEDALLAGDKAIGNAIATDTSLPGLSAVLASSITGINGVKGKSQTAAPEAAEFYVEGIVESGSLPGITGVPTSADYTTFAQTILKPVNANSSVAELVANAVAAKDSAGLPALAVGLFTKYPADVAKVTQGIAATIAVSGSYSDAARATFLATLTGSSTKYFASIAQGGIFVDPIASVQLTSAVLNALVPLTSAKALATDAGKIATIVGTTLGQDGDILANVGGLFGQLIAAGTLPVTSAGTYAADLITGAAKGLATTIPISVYPVTYPTADGGKLAIGTAKVPVVTQTVANDLASTVDLIASGIISTGTSAGNTKVAAEVASLVKSIATLAKFGTVNVGGAIGNVPVPVFLAGTLAKYISVMDSSLSASVNPLIESAVAAINPAKTYKAEVDALFTASSAGAPYQDYASVGAISTIETVVTNL